MLVAASVMFLVQHAKSTMISLIFMIIIIIRSLAGTAKYAAI